MIQAGGDGRTVPSGNDCETAAAAVCATGEYDLWARACRLCKALDVAVHLSPAGSHRHCKSVFKVLVILRHIFGKLYT